jgi:hypothetical protein
VQAVAGFIKKVVGKMKNLAKAGFHKVTGTFDGKKTGSGPNGEFTDEDKQSGLVAIDTEEQKYIDGEKISKQDAKKVAKVVKKNHPVFELLKVIDGKDSWDFEYIFRAKKEGARKAKTEMDRISVDFPLVDGKGNVYDADELNRQLKAQENSINGMTIKTWITNLNRHRTHGRIDSNRQSRRDHRRMYISLRIQELRREHSNKSEKELRKMAREDVDSFMAGRDVLHSPDSGFGGSGAISGLGDSDVNSHIGRHIKKRSDFIIQEIEKQGFDKDNDQVMMNVNLYIE